MPTIVSPVRPIQRDSRKNQTSKDVFQKKILNQNTQTYNSNKSELGIENYKAHVASPRIKFDSKRGNREHRDTYQPKGELIYGIYPVQLALEAQRRTFHHLMYKKGCELRNERIRDMVDTATSRGIRTTGLTLSQFRKVLTGDQTHQGICCDVSHLPFLAFQEHEYLTMNEDDKVADDREGTEGFQSSETKIPQLWIYLDQIQDPMNFGAVLRSANFFGVDKILTSECNRLVILYM